jgi:hypothetical protein
MIYVFPLCVLLVFLVLAAQYESWTLPLAVILIVPMSILCALMGVKLTGGDNNIFTQIALFVLVGLASKNAILIVEFARGAGTPRPQRRRRRAGSLPPAPASDPDDLDRFHHGCAAAGVLARRRRRDAPRDGCGGVCRHAGRDLLRPVPDAAVLRPAASLAARFGKPSHRLAHVEPHAPELEGALK